MIAANQNYNFNFLCPTMPVPMPVCYFSLSLLACTSFLNITFIAVDRLLAVSLHLRYQELVTSRRVAIALVSLWITSCVAASKFISFPANFGVVITLVVGCVELLLRTVAYIRICKVVRYLTTLSLNVGFFNKVATLSIRMHNPP